MDDWGTQYAKERRREWQCVTNFVRSAQTGDLPTFAAAIEEMEYTATWKPAFRRLVREGVVHPKLRERFPNVWARSGDHIRQEVDKGGLLFDALRLLLPAYTGPDMTLYRGEGWRNRCRRTYGASWSRERDVAEHHAQGLWQHSSGGSVLLETWAPAEAIICALHEHTDAYNEAEYVVDRRRLRALERYQQRAHGQPLTEALAF